MARFHHLLFACSLLVVLSALGCGSSGESTSSSTAVSSTERRFNDAMAAYAKQDWVEAVRLFDQVRVEAPASDIAQKATYYSALSRFSSGMYSGAAVDFRALIRNYPGSDYVPRAQYMIGESYYEISPRSELDQSYSLLAMNEFQTFLRAYPTAPDSLRDTAQARIDELRSRLAHKIFQAAELYGKMSDPKSAIIYYQRLLDNYYDSPFAPESELRIAELQLDRDSVESAKTALSNFEDKYLSTATPAERKRALKLRSKLLPS